MNNIINNILEESGFEMLIFEELEFFTFDKSTFYFKISLNVSDVKDIKKFEQLHSVENFDTFFKKYKKLLEKGEYSSIEKNSSLIILIRAENLEALESLKQQILLFEEDEYFFKKYVIIYSQESIINISSKPIISLLNDKIKNEVFFNNYKGGVVVNTPEMNEYLVVLQLFIKLPFLKLSFVTNEYVSLDEKIKIALSDSGEEVMDNLITISDSIFSTEFDTEEDDVLINQILKIFNDGEN